MGLELQFHLLGEKITLCLNSSSSKTEEVNRIQPQTAVKLEIRDIYFGLS